MNESAQLSIALLVVSDRAANGVYEDGCEAALNKFLQRSGHRLDRVNIVPDDEAVIAVSLRQWSDSGKFGLILTAGGTGVSPRDLTPDATATILEKEIPGIPEAMRAASAKITPNAILSRGRAGLRNRTLIVNLPGSPRAAVESLDAVFAGLLHGIAKANGDPSSCSDTLSS